MAEVDEAGAVAGVNVAPVTAWMERNIAGVEPPLEFRLVAGGRSNLTYEVADAAGRRYVLRRPPLGHVLATAHDVGREYRIIDALGPTDVPVPPALGWCRDEDVTGAPFYVMGFVEGVVPRDLNVAAECWDEPARRRAALSLIDVMARLHAVDPDAVGLGDLGRRDGYIQRQLKRWHGQFEQSKSRDIPDVDEVHDRLAATVPEQGPAAIVHGDYRIDNCVCHHDGPVAAVLDWELCTLGDPLADVGMLMICWTEPGDREPARPDSPTQLPGFPGRQEVLERYAAASGRDVSNIAYYRAFAHWKLACIGEGVYARYRAGVMGEQAGIDLDLMAQGVVRRAAAARRALEEAG
ncbi:MAG TPA: phosphotransferase family protein [Acidimicrobiales bacterium]|nr:phosphotransferase family protein [Acidimicrobiales bacterium]